MKQFVDFDARDAANLHALAKSIDSCLPKIVDRVFRAIDECPETRAVVSNEDRVANLRKTLLSWLRGLFTGDYGVAYARERALVGRAHARVGLDLHFLTGAMELVNREFERCIQLAPIRGKKAKLASLRKLLTIETGMMHRSYADGHIAQVRQAERDAMHARLEEAEKLAQVGQLAASLAHEIKNPLAGISGAIQVIRDSMRPENPHWPIIEGVLQQIGRLDHTVKDLLVFARPKPPRYQRCDLQRAILRVVSLLRKEPAFARIKFECTGEQNLPAIAADEHQFEQLLMNLLLNAAHASSEDGLVRLTSAADGDRVRFAVADRGCGMTVDVARRAMEPFFTTKARGTGLGLPICHKIVEAHGGHILIQSTPDEGTEVTVELLASPATTDSGRDDEHTRSDS